MIRKPINEIRANGITAKRPTRRSALLCGAMAFGLATCLSAQIQAAECENPDQLTFAIIPTEENNRRIATL